MQRQYIILKRKIRNDKGEAFARGGYHLNVNKCKTPPNVFSVSVEVCLAILTKRSNQGKDNHCHKEKDRKHESGSSVL